MSELEYFKKVLVNIKEKTPILFMEKASELFLKIYRGEVFTIDPETKEEDIKRLRENLLYIPDDYFVVIKDISILGTHFLSSLLKLIEESKAKFILLASLDINQKSAPMLYSRMKYIVKLPWDSNTNNILLKTGEALRNLNEDIPRDITYAEECPGLFYLEYMTRNYKLKNKYVNFLGD